MWRLQNDWVKKEIKGEIKRYIETNENENMTYQNFWNAVKAVIREKFISLQGCLKTQEKSQVNNWTLYFKELLKEKKGA